MRGANRLFISVTMVGEEGGDLLGDGRVGLVRQTDVLETGNRLPLGPIRGRAFRKEPVDNKITSLFRGQFRRNRSADQRTSAPQDGNGVLVDAVASEQLFLRVPAGVPERNALPRVKGMSLLLKFGGDVMGQRQIHVVAAEQQVVSDRQPLQAQFPVSVVQADQREVGRAATDVDHQHHVASGHQVTPVVFGRRKASIHRRLRLFQQHELVGKPGLHGRLPC